MGAAWFKNMLTVFDFGADETRLAKLEGEVTESGGASGGNGTPGGTTGGGGGNGTSSASGNGAAFLAGGWKGWTFLAVVTAVFGAGIGLF